MFLSESGKLYSSGLGSDGQTGLGHYSCQFTPSQVEGDVKNEKMIKVACSADCVLSLNGECNFSIQDFEATLLKLVQVQVDVVKKE